VPRNRDAQEYEDDISQDSGDYDYPEEPMETRWACSRGYEPDLLDELQVSDIRKFTLASLSGRASYRSWTADNSGLSDRSKLLIRSLRLLFIHPMGLRCCGSPRTCSNRANWYELDLGIASCCVEHLQKYLVEVSSPKKKTKIDDLEYQLSSYRQGVAGQAAMRNDSNQIDARMYGTIVPGSSSRTPPDETIYRWETVPVMERNTARAVETEWTTATVPITIDEPDRDR
jgi:hypothetical protein